MDQAFQQLAEAAGRNWMWTMMAAVFIVGTVFSAVKNMVKYTARERTRREIAAYIAEGSLTSDQGERLMKAGKSTHDAA